MCLSVCEERFLANRQRECREKRGDDARIDKRERERERRRERERYKDIEEER